MSHQHMFGTMILTGDAMRWQAREELISMSTDDASRKLRELPATADVLISRVEARAMALDKYAQLVDEMDLRPAVLRRRILSFAIMGAVPLGIAGIAAVALWQGYLQSGNARTFAGVVIMLGILLVLLATAAAIHATVDAYVHQTLRAERARDLNYECAVTIAALINTDSQMGPAIASKVQKHKRLADLVAKILSSRS